jgi:hypothetical protein
MITAKDVDRCHVVQSRHSNMGYVMDEHGNYTDRHKGYAYGYRCVEYPRFSFEDRHYTLDDGGWQRTYKVDGEECKYEDVPRLLNQSPQLTLVELYVWLRMGDHQLPWYSMIDWIAGCEQPEPHYIDSATRWGKVHNVADRLREKGLVTIDAGMAKRSTGQ